MTEPGNGSASDGGQPYLNWNLDAHKLEKHESNLLRVLGAALLARWAEIPRDLQRAIFESATSHADIEPEVLRGQLARFFKDNAVDKDQL